MSRLVLVSDSNVYRNVNANVFSSRIHSSVLIVNAARQHTLELGLIEVTKLKYDFLIVSALSNIICDAVGVPKDDDSPTTKALIGKTVSNHFCLVIQHASPSSKILFVPPFFRTVPLWYSHYLNSINKFVHDEALKHKNVVLLPEFKVCSLDVSSDSVHLTPKAAEHFVDYLCSCILDFQPALETVTVSHSSEFTSPPSVGSSSDDVLNYLWSWVTPRLDDLTGLRNQFVGLERRFENRSIVIISSWNDSQTSANISRMRNGLIKLGNGTKRR